MEWNTAVLIIAIFKGLGLLCMLVYITYRFQTNTVIQYFEETRFSATWGYLFYTLMLPVPTFIAFVVALIKKTSICARFTLMCLYFGESIFVLGWPLGFLRSVVIGIRNDDQEALVLLALVIVYMMFLYPIRILCAYTVRGYYLDLRFYSRSQAQGSKRDEKKSLSQYMNPSTSDKSSVFSNEERKLSDIELGSIGKNKRSGGKRKNSKRESSGSRDHRRTSDLVPVNQMDVSVPESRGRASSGTTTELVIP